MRTAREKAEEWVHKNVILAEHCDIEYSDVIEKLEDLLKGQDRDTRHACAEAVSNCSPVCETPSGSDAILPGDAHDQCINVKCL